MTLLHGDDEAAGGVSHQALAALRDHFRSGRGPVGWRGESVVVPYQVRMQLSTLALEVPSDGGAQGITRIATDGSGNETGIVTAAAVASTGQALVGWCDGRLPVDAAQYSELTGIRLALRLTESLGAPAEVVCDSPVVVGEVHRASRGQGIRLSPFGCDDPEAFAEVTRLAATLPGLQLTSRPHGHLKPGGNRVKTTANGPLEARAHALAWSVHRILLDTLDPAGQEEILSLIGADMPRTHGAVLRAYRKHQARVTPAASSIEPIGDKVLERIAELAESGAGAWEIARRTSVPRDRVRPMLRLHASLGKARHPGH